MIAVIDVVISQTVLTLSLVLCLAAVTELFHAHTGK
jgi:hypothetical protein